MRGNTAWTERHWSNIFYVLLFHERGFTKGVYEESPCRRRSIGDLVKPHKRQRILNDTVRIPFLMNLCEYTLSFMGATSWDRFAPLYKGQSCPL